MRRKVLIPRKPGPRNPVDDPLPTPIVRSIPARAQNVDQFIERAYDPDAKYREMEKPTPSLLARFLAALFERNKDGSVKGPSQIPGVEYATIVEVNGLGGYRTRKVDGVDFCAAVLAAEAGWSRVHKILASGLRLVPDNKLTKAERDARQKLREATFDTDDPEQTNRGANSFTEYTPIMGGPFSKQLYLHNMLDGFAKAFEAYNHNPVAHQAVKIITHFVLGRGVTWKACHPECQKAWIEWAERVDLDHRLEMWSDTLSRDGELMIRKAQGKGGQLILRWIDPSTVWEIVTDLEDMETGMGYSSVGVIYYHQQFPTQYQLLYSGGAAQQFEPSRFEASKYVINQIPADEVLHYKINVGPNEKRGRSDLFPVLGWLKRYKDFWTAKVLKAIMQATFAWKNKIKGSDADVQAFINNFGTQQPEFGSVWVENEASELSTMTVDSTDARGADQGDGILNMIAVGLGIPKEYLGAGDASTRATAVVASEPGAKKFQGRQQLFTRVLRDIANDFFALELAAKRLPMTIEKVNEETGQTEQVPHNPYVEPIFPEIAVEDRSAKIKDIQVAEEGRHISHKRSCEMIAKELGIQDYDYEREQEEIAEEDADAALGLYKAVPPGSEFPAPKSNGGLSSEERRAAHAAGRS